MKRFFQLLGILAPFLALNAGAQQRANDFTTNGNAAARAVVTNILQTVRSKQTFTNSARAYFANPSKSLTPLSVSAGNTNGRHFSFQMQSFTNDFPAQTNSYGRDFTTNSWDDIFQFGWNVPSSPEYNSALESLTWSFEDHYNTATGVPQVETYLGWINPLTGFSTRFISVDAFLDSPEGLVATAGDTRIRDKYNTKDIFIFQPATNGAPFLHTYNGDLATLYSRTVDAAGVVAHSASGSAPYHTYNISGGEIFKIISTGFSVVNGGTGADEFSYNRSTRTFRQCYDCATAYYSRTVSSVGLVNNIAAGDTAEHQWSVNGALKTSVDASGLHLWHPGSGAEIFGLYPGLSRFDFNNSASSTRARLGLVDLDSAYFLLRDSNNVTRVNLSTAGDSYLTGGRLGIGTNAPGAALHVGNGGSLYVDNDVSAASFTDRSDSPDSLAQALAIVTSHESANGKVNHKKLNRLAWGKTLEDHPDFGLDEVPDQSKRNLSMVASAQSMVITSLLERTEALERNVKILFAALGVVTVGAGAVAKKKKATA